MILPPWVKALSVVWFSLTIPPGDSNWMETLFDIDEHMLSRDSCEQLHINGGAWSK